METKGHAVAAELAQQLFSIAQHGRGLSESERQSSSHKSHLKESEAMDTLSHRPPASTSVWFRLMTVSTCSQSIRLVGAWNPQLQTRCMECSTTILLQRRH